MSDFVWSPPPALVERANVTRLARRLGCAGYHELHGLSVRDPDRFWPAVVADLGLEFVDPWERVLDTSEGIEWAKWFVGGRLNVASNCVHKWRHLPGEAAVGRGGDGRPRALTWPQPPRPGAPAAEAPARPGVQGGARR